jgi:hypothetical protein
MATIFRSAFAALGAFGWRSAFSAAIQAAASDGFSSCGAASSAIPVLAEL